MADESLHDLGRRIRSPGAAWERDEEWGTWLMTDVRDDGSINCRHEAEVVGEGGGGGSRSRRLVMFSSGSYKPRWRMLNDL